jgi:tetratricopeptide (TPR) repeat protein
MQANEAKHAQPPEIRNAMASGWMKRGIALLNENTTASLTASLRWFEGAIELRLTLPLHENSWYRYVLAAGWMNRGDALTRLGSTENLAEAVRSYDQALALLQTLELESNRLFRKRLALAWMNRGITLQEQGTSMSSALASFDEAVCFLRDPGALEDADNRPILACALMNRGNVLLRLTPPELARARESAEQALILVAGAEEEDLLAAETGLKARHILCRAIASQVADGTATIVREDMVAAATDAVDDGMKLARLWEARGESRFRGLAAALFHFGASAYQTHQSHFLTEFLLENLDPSESSDAFPVDSKMHATASDAIARALAGIQRDGFQLLNTPRFDRFLKALRQLRAAEARLKELRCTHPSVVAQETKRSATADRTSAKWTLSNISSTVGP